MRNLTEKEKTFILEDLTSYQKNIIVISYDKKEDEYFLGEKQGTEIVCSISYNRLISYVLQKIEKNQDFKNFLIEIIDDKIDTYNQVKELNSTCWLSEHITK